MNKTTNKGKQDAENATSVRLTRGPNTVAQAGSAPATTPATRPTEPNTGGSTGTIESPQLAADRERLLQEEQAKIDQEKQDAVARERELARFD